MLCMLCMFTLSIFTVHPSLCTVHPSLCTVHLTSAHNAPSFSVLNSLHSLLDPPFTARPFILSHSPIILTSLSPFILSSRLLSYYLFSSHSLFILFVPSLLTFPPRYSFFFLFFSFLIFLLFSTNFSPSFIPFLFFSFLKFLNFI
jgi:hypothetical protein